MLLKQKIIFSQVSTKYDSLDLSKCRRVKHLTLLIPSQISHLKINAAVVCPSQTFVSENEACKHRIKGNFETDH